MTRRWLLALPLLAGLAYSSHDEYLAARRKFRSIESDRLPAGSRVAITSGELNSWVREEVRQQYAGSVRQPSVVLRAGGATGSALIDFDKLRRAQGASPGWLATQLLSGDRPVSVTARLRSSGGRATVDVERVEVSGIAIEGALLDYLIRNYLIPNYPDAKVGRPFELGHRMESIDVGPSAVTVLIRR
jgi:uncharacterized protein YfiM (DUF2279 family)